MTDSDERKDCASVVDAAFAAPPNITRAINEVARAVKMLGKKNYNGINKYRYASIDEFVLAVGEHVAKNGLNIHSSIVDHEIVRAIVGSGEKAKEHSMLALTIDFTFSHASGEYWDKPFRQFSLVQLVAGTSPGSAEAYALKQFLRAQFMVATGDRDDIDALDNQPVQQCEPLSKADQREMYKELQDQIDKLEGLGDCVGWMKLKGRDVKAMNTGWQAHILSRFMGQVLKVCQSVEELDAAQGKFSRVIAALPTNERLVYDKALKVTRSDLTQAPPPEQDQEAASDFPGDRPMADSDMEAGNPIDGEVVA